MLFEGWHAALIGAERVPWAAQDLGSAPVPRPLPELDAQAGITAQRVEQERRRLNDLLGLGRAGVTVTSGGKTPRVAAGTLTFLTSLCRDPEATWEWMHFASRDEAILKSECRRGIPRQERAATIHRGDPEWFPYPYQEQVFRIMEKDCQLWPEPPVHSTVGTATQDEVFYKYFNQQNTSDLPTILSEARKEVRRFSDAANRDLAKRIEDGMARPADWTFADWDPKNADKFFSLQQEKGPSDADSQELALARQKLAQLAQSRPELNIASGPGALREDVWKFRNPDSPWQALYIPGLMAIVVLGWLLFMALRDRRARRPVLAETWLGAKRGWHAYVFVAPGMVAIFAFAIYPSLYQFWLAVHSGDGLETMRYVGLDNFRRILDPASSDFDRVFWGKVLPNSAIYMVIVTAGHITLGLLFALLLNMPLRANRTYRVLYFIPLVTSLAVVSVIMIGLLRGPDSGLNQVLRSVGLGDLPYWLGLVDRPGRAHDWLGSKTGLFAVMGVAIWHGLPYTIILLLAGLQSISPDLYEAAKVDGAGPWKRFRHVTIPELLPILIIIIFNSFIGAARALGSVLVLTEGGVDHSSEVVALYIFKWGFMRPDGQEANLGYASALGIVYSAMLAALTITNVTIIARRWKRRLAAERAANAPVPVPQTA
jgi:ABC-type sugar transport system permease subunit